MNHLGNNGRLANQMFQYAFLKSMAIKHDADFVIPPSEIFGKHYYLNVFSSMDDCFNLQCDRALTNYPTIQERFFHYDERLFEEPPNINVNYYGFFQTEKYFKHIEDDVRKDFTFKDEILEPCSEFMSDNKEVIALHIRRSDYLSNSNHPVQGLDYYEKALEKFEDTIPVIIFSDDVDWCKEQKLFESDRFMISETNDTYQDLCLMSLCTHHIISNSSYSWWGSWLAKSKKTVAPQNWFSGDNINHNTKDLYLSDWIIL
jgi:hypothetical protein